MTVEVENRIGLQIPVGPSGYVRLVDVMGDDRRIVDAARISYGRHETKRDDEKDRALIRYLMRKRHTSPFEHAEMQFIVKCPMDVWRQWIRHRTASVNEYSTRYSEAIDEAAITEPNAWRLQSASNKQGSENARWVERQEGTRLSDREAAFLGAARAIYEERLESGVAREQARKDLPLSTYTIAYWKIDLHNLLHFLSLRMDPHAQQEIRHFATIVYFEFVKPLFPWTCEAFEDYRLKARTFSGPERKVVTVSIDEEALASSDLSEREIKELREKVETWL